MIVIFIAQNLGFDDENTLQSALSLAAEFGLFSLVKFLVNHGVNVNYQDCDAFQIAACCGHVEIVKFLHQAGADLHVFQDHALRIAIENDNWDVADYLIHEGATARASGWNEALRGAAIDGSLQAIELCLKAGASPELVSFDDIRHMYRSGFFDILVTLSNHGVFVPLDLDYFGLEPDKQRM